MTHLTQQSATAHPTIDWANDLYACARLALACLDLTSLGEDDSETNIWRMCQRAQSTLGSVAAVCVLPHFAAFARKQVPEHIAVASVANFPDGSADVQRALRDTAMIVQSGAQEVDLVLPYTNLIAGDERTVVEMLAAVRKACPGLRLKVILETGELRRDELIERACRLAIEAGADFLKTSTGKTPLGATTQAARIMLKAIASDPSAANRVGFKVSGGIRTVQDAAAYIVLCHEYLGPTALNPQRFRIGASSLLGDIRLILGGVAAGAAAPVSSY
jgi:deoxyribose-phosphate aldolase